MKNENISNPEFGGSSPQEEIVLKDLLLLLFRHRIWFVISVIVMVALGVLYVKTKPNIYSRTATVIVEDERRGGSVSEAAAFQEIFNMGGGSVYNEMGLFNSNRLMYEVVDRLNLAISYRVRDQLRTKELYRSTPVVVSFEDFIPAQRVSFILTMISTSQAQIRELTFHDPISSKLNVVLEDRVITLGSPVETDFGVFMVSSTLFMNEKFIDQPIYITRNNPKDVARRYNDALNVSLVDKYASILTISIADESINRAEDVINTLIEVYRDDAIDDKNRILENTSTFIDERLAIIETDLTAVDAEIETYKKDNNLTDLVSEGSMHLQSMNRLDQESLNVLNQLSMAKYMKSYLEDEANVSALLPVNVGITDSGLQQQVSVYNEYMNKRNKLLVNSSDSNPLVVDMQNILVGMRSSILLSVNNLIASLEIQSSNFTRKENENLGKIRDISSQQKYIVSVERQQKIKEELYLYLLNKKEESELQRSITESNCRIVDSAEGSDSPVAPNKKMIVLFCFMLGLALPAGVIYVITLFNTTVSSRKDLKGVLTVPYLGDIPIETTSIPKDNIVVEAGNRSALNESFSIVRDNIDFMSGDKSDRGHVIQLTSLNPASGKTFITVNMAMSMALGGSKVIIVDLDVRMATLSKILGYGTKGVGVSQYLNGNVASISELIVKHPGGVSFDVVPAGVIPPNPAELLKSKRLPALLDELRKEYDYIFIDNPPYGIVVDAAICARYSDQTIYVIRAGKCDKRFLPDIQEVYDSGKLPNMSLLLNGVNYETSNYGYGYSYSYSYQDEKKKSWIRTILGV